MRNGCLSQHAPRPSGKTNALSATPNVKTNLKRENKKHYETLPAFPKDRVGICQASTGAYKLPPVGPHALGGKYGGAAEQQMKGGGWNCVPEGGVGWGRGEGRERGVRWAAGAQKEGNVQFRGEQAAAVPALGYTSSRCQTSGYNMAAVQRRACRAACPSSSPPPRLWAGRRCHLPPI